MFKFAARKVIYFVICPGDWCATAQALLVQGRGGAEGGGHTPTHVRQAVLFHLGKICISVLQIKVVDTISTLIKERR